MKILTLSGSTRRFSTNTALLHFLAENSPSGIYLNFFPDIGELPIFSPDWEGSNTPEQVREFIAAIEAADGVIISSPEYVHAIPGGLKNAIDWLVSGDAIIDKPIFLVHASHRGEDMLKSLRLVLNTVSANFNEDLFLRFPLLSKTTAEIWEYLETEEHIGQIHEFLTDVKSFIENGYTPHTHLLP